MKYFITLIGLIGTIFFLYFYDFSAPSDYNWESLDIPLTVGYLTSGKDHSQVLENYKQQDGVAAHGYPRGRFRFDHMALAQPIQCVSYIPFIKIFGVSNKAIAWYAMFYCIIAWVLTAYIAYTLFGKWEALLSVFFLATSLSWLIHAKAAVISVMPSVCLFLGLVIAVIKYSRCYYSGNNNEEGWAILMGGIVGLSFLTGWIVFPFACLFLALNWRILIGSIRYLIIFSVATIVWFSIIYSLTFGLPGDSILLAVWDAYTYRFFQGQNPHYSPELWEKPFIAVKQLFWDTKALDHPDKYLAGSAAISPIFTGFFLYGLWTHKQKILNHWLIAVFLVLVTVYAYAGRYAMIALPGMVIIAAWGFTYYWKNYRSNTLKGIFIVLLLTNALWTWGNYYVKFTKESPPDFERDRVRGHTALYDWVKANYNPEDTVLVYPEPISTPPLALMFHAFDKPYKFVIGKNPQVKAKNVIYVFHAQILMTDLKPTWEYRYQNRPMIYAYLAR